MSDQLNFAKMFTTSRESQQKFDYYFLGVIIALLSFSIQTFTPTSATKFMILINIVWILLLISMLAGFSRLENVQLIFHYDTKRIYELEFENNKPDSIMIKKYFELSQQANKKALFLYKIEKWTFVSALIIYLIFKLLNVYMTI